MSKTRRRIRLIGKATGLRIPIAWYRHRGLEPADVFIASYPRSGNTWLRFLLFDMLTGREVEFGSVRDAIPYIGKHRGAPGLLPTGGRLIKTHEPYRAEYARSIYLVRDVRDVVLSEHSYQSMRGYYAGDFDAFLRVFLDGRVHGLGSWTEHVTRWLEAPPDDDARLLVRFEELRGDTTRTLRRVVEHLGLEVDDGTIQRAIENNTIRRMQEKEDRAKLKKAREDLRHVGGGGAGGWRARLNGSQVERIESSTAALLERLGYPLAAEPGSDER